MRNPLFLKVLAIGCMLMLISIPLTMIGSIVHERQQRQSEAVNEIGASYAGPQKLIGPILTLPYTENFTTEGLVTSDDGKKRERKIERHSIERIHYVMPTELSVQGKLITWVKRRGLFQAPVYEWKTDIKGKFQLPDPANPERSHKDSQITLNQPYVAIGISDTRGLSGTPVLQWGDQQSSFEKGSGIGFSESGMHAAVALPEAGKNAIVTFNLALGLHGTQRLSVVPLGDSNHIELTSPWQHPSFGGRFLPDAEGQSVGAEGFHAAWNISALASAAPQQFQRAAANTTERCQDGSCLESLEVRLIEPVNIYTQSDRALKYGFLFVGIAFAAFFLFELIKRLRLHPAQYFLVGLALFFLLVLSLSEHIAFAQAYLAAAAASTALIGFYLAHILHSAWRGIGFSAMLGLLFAVLYGLLISEDNALMLGSLLLFGLLAIVMVLTRRIDWYRIGAGAEAEGLATAK